MLNKNNLRILEDPIEVISTEDMLYNVEEHNKKVLEMKREFECNREDKMRCKSCQIKEIYWKTCKDHINTENGRCQVTSERGEDVQGQGENPSVAQPSQQHCSGGEEVIRQGENQSVSQLSQHHCSGDAEMRQRCQAQTSEDRQDKVEEMISRSNLEATMPVTVTNQQDEMTDEGMNTDLEALLPDTRPGRAVVEVKDCQPSSCITMGWDNARNWTTSVSGGGDRVLAKLWCRC